MSKICRTFAAKSGKVMKRIYIQPEIEISNLTLTTIICTSAGEGPDAPGDTIGD